MFEFLQQKQSPIDQFTKRKQEIQIKLGRFSSSFLVQKVFEIKGHGKAFAGKVMRGKITAGQTVYFSGNFGKIELIEAFKKSIIEAKEGQSVAIKVSGIEMPIERGALLHFK